MTSITAIVPTYNRANFLSECLQALVSQTRPVEEIIVWDDGSTDSTKAVVQDADGPIRYFRSANGGKSKALNAALAQASGDLIWICDDDDIVVPNGAERLAGMLESAPEAGVAAGSYRRFREDPASGTRTEEGPGYWPDLNEGSILRHLLEDIFLFQNATLVRRALYDRVGPFREDLARSIDYDMIVRLALRAPVEVTEDVIFFQRKHEGRRGPASARHEEAQSEDVWKSADRNVFAPFYESIPISVFTAMFDGALADRAGLLQRACVYARRTDWERASRDFEAAAQMFPETELADKEVAICRRAMAGKHGIAEALEPGMRARLACLAGLGRAGKDIASSLSRGALWRGRAAISDRRFADATRVARFCFALSDLQLRRGKPQQPLALTERQNPALQV